MAEELIRVENLVKRFDGLVATDDVSLSLRKGQVHALIGPNGAGKTTLINLLSGQLRPDGGRVLMRGRDVTHASVAARARLGLARSFQITSLFFGQFTVLDNIAMAIQAHQGHSFRFWRDVRKDAKVAGPAMEMLARLGLEDRAHACAVDLSHGEHRQMELAMVLATRPHVLLLDEPAAGMSHDESARIVSLLAEIKNDYAILLVEHDMNAVFALADVITVLVNGRTLASGPPCLIRGSPEVRAVYLGEEKARLQRQEQSREATHGKCATGG